MYTERQYHVVVIVEHYLFITHFTFLMNVLNLFAQQSVAGMEIRFYFEEKRYFFKFFRTVSDPLTFYDSKNMNGIKFRSVCVCVYMRDNSMCLFMNIFVVEF